MFSYEYNTVCQYCYVCVCFIHAKPNEVTLKKVLQLQSVYKLFRTYEIDLLD